MLNCSNSPNLICVTDMLITINIVDETNLSRLEQNFHIGDLGRYEPGDIRVSFYPDVPTPAGYITLDTGNQIRTQLNFHSRQ